jgi:DNA primase
MKNDPIKKADLIRDMVVSISKIPDRIQRDLYSGCSRIMDISEQVLSVHWRNASEKTTRWVNKKNNTLEIVKVKIHCRRKG